MHSIMLCATVTSRAAGPPDCIPFLWLLIHIVRTRSGSVPYAMACASCYILADQESRSQWAVVTPVHNHSCESLWTQCDSRQRIWGVDAGDMGSTCRLLWAFTAHYQTRRIRRHNTCSAMPRPVERCSHAVRSDPYLIGDHSLSCRGTWESGGHELSSSRG